MKVADVRDGNTNNEAAAEDISNGVDFPLLAQEGQKQGFPNNHKLKSNQPFGLAIQPLQWI